MFLKRTLPGWAGILLIFILISCNQGPETQGDPWYVFSGPPLRQLADKISMNVGAAVNPSHLSESTYAYILQREFNTVVAENSMKFSYLYSNGGESETFDFTTADTLVNFAKQHNMKIRGHVFLWHNNHQIPRRVKFANGVSGTLRNYSEMQGIMENHIEAVLDHYNDDIYAWDVANEIFTDPYDSDQDSQNYTPELRNRTYSPDGSSFSVWASSGTDDTVIRAAFAKADAKLTELGIRNNVQLILCDYNNEQKGSAKGDAFYNLVADWVNDGVPIDGVGFQMHIMEEYSDPVDNAGYYTNVIEQITRLQALGLDVQFTEIDVRIKTSDGVSLSEYTDQAEAYAKLMLIARDKNMKTYVIWGITDKYSWIPSTFSSYGEALLFDTNYRIKDAYLALKRALDS